jgi:opine dehydrogenase
MERHTRSHRRLARRRESAETLNLNAMIRSIGILGAGHGGYAAAADLTRLGFDVVLQSRNPARLDPIRERGGIEMHGVHDGFVPVKRLTLSVAEAVAGCDLIMLVVPSPAVGDYARELAPLMTPQHTVLINPGHTGGGLHFVNALRQAGYHGDVRTAETVTLTYICRSTAPATVSLYSYTKSLAFAAFPGRHAQALFETIRQIYPQLELATSVLETALTNINATFHPPGMLMNAGWIEHSRGEFLFYHEGITESVARVIAAIDRERMAVAEALDVAWCSASSPSSWTPVMASVCRIRTWCALPTPAASSCPISLTPTA